MDAGEINTRRSRFVAGGAGQHLFLFCRWIVAIQHLYLWAGYFTHQPCRGRTAASGDRHWHWRGQPDGGISFGGEKPRRDRAAPPTWACGPPAVPFGNRIFISVRAPVAFGGWGFLRGVFLL